MTPPQLTETLSSHPPTVLPYHRLARASRHHRWWRPLLALVAFVVFAVGLLGIGIVATVVAGLANPSLAPAVGRVLAMEDLSDPLTALVAFGVLAVLIPPVLLAVRVAGARPVGTLLSVAGRMRWPLLARTTGLALVILLLVQGAGLLLSPAPRAEVGWSGASAALLAVALLVVPLQAAAEELVFRGLLMQTIGAWLRHPAWAVLLPVPLFVLGHDYTWLAQIDIVVFALAAGWLTWRTGGLEAAIGLHVANNSLIMVGGALGVADLNATDLSVPALLVSVTITVAFTLLVTRRPQWWRPSRATEPEALPDASTGHDWARAQLLTRRRSTIGPEARR